MPRGKEAPVGTRTIAANGYVYQKTKSRGWVLYHWLVWERAHGRLVDTSAEQIRFKDGDKRNFTIENLVAVPKNTSSVRKRLAAITAKITELQHEKEYLEQQLLASSSKRDS